MGIALSGTAHLVCSPDRPSGAERFDPAWRTETVKALALGIMVDYAFDRFPILADALEEAGCTDPIMLKHCRECTHHQHSCWVLTCVSQRPIPQLDEQRILAELDDIVPAHSRHAPQLYTNEDFTRLHWADSDWYRPASRPKRAIGGIVLLIAAVIFFHSFRVPSQTTSKKTVVKKYTQP
jgi:hypothetical protein